MGGELLRCTSECAAKDNPAAPSTDTGTGERAAGTDSKPSGEEDYTKADQTPNGEDRRKRKRESSQGRPENSPGKKPSQPSATMASALKFRPGYLKVAQTAEMLIKQIGLSENYMWARGSELEELQSLLHAAGNPPKRLC